MRTISSLLIVVVLLLGCSLRKIAVRQAVAVMQESRDIFEGESDLGLAESALASNLKLLEVMLRQDPDNRALQQFLAEGYAGFTLAFVEDKAEEYDALGHDDLAQTERERAKKLYYRSCAFSAPALKEVLAGNPQTMSEEQLTQALKKITKEQIAPLFWYAFAWGSAVNLDRDNLDSLAQLSKIEKMMQRVKELDDSYYYGGAWLFEGVYYGARGVTLGGDLEKSKAAFEKAAAISQRKLLMTEYFYAATYCVFAQDKNCFAEKINYILNAPDDILPQQNLANALAKRKARRLQARAPDIFLE